MERHDVEQKKIVLNADDMRNALTFFEHFKIPMPESIQKLLVKFEADSKSFTFDDQVLFRAYLAHAVETANHPLVKSDEFKNIREKCSAAWYEASFDFDLEEIISSPREV